MRRALLIGIIGSAFMGCRAQPPARAGVPLPDSEYGAVATVHDLATAAGWAAMANGGNAVDAAVAAALTLGVVDGFNSGLGGGCFILIHTAQGRLIAIDGRETAPALASRDMYLRNGTADASLSQTGPLAVGTPGALAAYDRALRNHGRLNLAELLLPAAKLAEDGFILDTNYASRLATSADKLRKSPAAARIFFKPDGSPRRAGDLLQQHDLATTYRAIAEHGTDYFYRGPIADKLDRWMRENGGLLRKSDLAEYKPLSRKPIVTTYRGHTLVGFPPPSSGGVHVAQILNILENYDLKSIHAQDPALFTHLVAEAMKLAFADRAHWLGDPDYVDVPRGLLDKRYANTLAQRINPDRILEVPVHGTPPDKGTFQKSEVESQRSESSNPKPQASSLKPLERHTTHLSAADAEGNWVSITATINTTFGSGVVVPGTGLVLNNEMDDFAIAPGVPNAFGLVGAEANAVEPGKRPLSSMSPTIVLRDGRPVMALGAAGGPRIITQVLLWLIHSIDLKMEPHEALAAARVHHQWKPDITWLEPHADPAVHAGLWSRGHRVESPDSSGVTQVIGFDPRTRRFIAVREPRLTRRGVQP